MQARTFMSIAAICLISGCAGPRELTKATLSATLTGYQTTPAAGDLDGTGTAQVRLDSEQAQLCWEVNARGIDPATELAIHPGAAGIAGPAVASLTAPDASGRSQGCAAVAAALASEILRQPHLFYLNAANRPFPGGAIRGQLRRTGVTRSQQVRR